MKSISYEILTLALAVNLLACGSTKKVVQPIEHELSEKAIINANDFPILEGSWAGIVFQDLSDGKFILRKNEERYFRPASNTKILTLYNALKTLPDSLTAYEIYRDRDNKKILVPKADPTYLNSLFSDCGFKNLIGTELFDGVDLSRWQQPKYGKGWMWDDLDDTYALPMTAMPIYGNMVEISVEKEDSGLKYKFQPSNHSYKISTTTKEAYFSQDTIYLPAFLNKDAKYAFPLKNAHIVAMNHISSDNNISTKDFILEKSIKNCALDTIYKAMMYDSDNFLAEYLLLNAGAVYTDTYSSLLAIDTLTKLHFGNFSHLPKWVDGSGMSHYNLVNPNFLVELLGSMWKERGDKLLHYFPEGGRQGTIKNWYAPHQGNPPYVFAKTGTISNVYCLSGYMKTKANKTFAFSIMVNNFLGGATPVRREIQKLLEKIRDGY